MVKYLVYYNDLPKRLKNISPVMSLPLNKWQLDVYKKVFGKYLIVEKWKNTNEQNIIYKDIFSEIIEF